MTNIEIEGRPERLPSISYFKTEEVIMSVKSQEKNMRKLAELLSRDLGLRKEAGSYGRAA